MYRSIHIHQSANVVIDYVHYDAVGNDHYNLNDKYVVILNQGSSDAGMSGWKLKDEYGHAYVFPSFILRAGKEVTVYTGSGTDTQDELYWGRSSAVWNNDSDTAYLYDASMELVD